MAPDVCGECPHPPARHDDWGNGCSDCSCLLSNTEAIHGRDEDLDESIRQALWEDAVVDGWVPETFREE